MSLLDNNILETTDIKYLGFPNRNDFVSYWIGYLDKYSVYEWRNDFVFINAPTNEEYIKALGIRVCVYNTAVHNKALERKHGTTYRIKIGYIYKSMSIYWKTSEKNFYESFKYLFDFDKLFNSEEEAIHCAYDILLKIKQEPKILNKTYYLQNKNNLSIFDKSEYTIAHLKKFMGKHYEPIR